MTNEQIEKFIEPRHLAIHSVKIDFKTRNSMVGVFIKANDYKELKAKNFWRIVTGNNVENWMKTQDTSLARIFNGSEITKLTAI
jgi:hypothetical protein